MFGAYSRVNSRIVARIAGDEVVVQRRAAAGLSSQKTRSPSVPRSERWMWQELPSRSLNLAMNVSARPCCSAISLAVFL